MDVIVHPLVLSALALGFMMAWAVGANDVANAMASTVGSKILTVTQAVVIASVFEALGSLLASGQVTHMIRQGVVDTSTLASDPIFFALGMIASLLAASTWLFLATKQGWPVSTTHTIIGAVIGFAIVQYGVAPIQWLALTKIGLSWVLTPPVAGLVSYVFFEFIRKNIFDAEHPEKKARLFLPLFTAITVAIFCSVTLFQGLSLLGFALPSHLQWIILIGSTLVAYIASDRYLARKLDANSTVSIDIFQRLDNIEARFSFLAILTAATMAFAHGANDVANAIGPSVAVYSIMHEVLLGQKATFIPIWIVALGSTGIVLGLITFGYKIMQTVGSNITQLTPSRGFVAQFSTSSIIMIASGLGLPVSTTQTMVGSILGVGLARGFLALNLTVIRSIFLSWMITLPAGAMLSSVFFYLLSSLYRLYV